MPVPPLIDVHTHVFNAGSIPLQGVFQSRVGDPRYAKVIGVIARLLERAIENDNSLPDKLRARLKVSPIPNDDEERADQLIVVFAGSLKEAYLDSNADDINLAVDELELHGVFLSSLDDADTIALLALDRGSIRRRLSLLLKWLVQEMEQGAAIVVWVLLMLASESQLLSELTRTWPTTSVFVHHMMDMDNHYPPGAAKYPFVTLQIRRMRKLAADARGRLIGFVAFDPFRGRDDNGKDGVDIVIDALHDGFAGVKFYPPSGYKPTDNQDSDFHDPHPSAADVNARNDRLFSECQRLGVPIFAHCSPGGMERWEGSGIYSHPKYWALVLHRYPRLRLCLGHAGGDEGWCSGQPSPEEDFVPDVICLCKSYENVYCEFGHTETLIDHAARPIFARRLEEAISDNKAAYPFSTKIMYGSDWHLLARIPDSTDYQRILREIFQQSHILAKHEDHFFGSNAIAYLNIPQFLARNPEATTEGEQTYLGALTSGE